jgi:deazaflavin-dependent oxidoreductase (nitroreductase family)
MNPVTRRLARAAMALAVRLYRWSNGRIGGTAVGRTPVLLLTVAGRTTGTPRTTPVSYFEHDGAVVVVGSGGGSQAEPQWMRNLRAATRAHVQIKARHVDLAVRMAEGEERDTLWRDVVVRRAPAFAAYEPKAHRTMPIAVLTPVESGTG